MIDLIKQSFSDLFPYSTKNYDYKLTYSGKFSPYNAKVEKTGDCIHFKLSREWSSVSQEIVLGLVHVLLLKLFRKQKTTFNIDLYHSFLKRLPDTVKKTPPDVTLLSSFRRVNHKYFAGVLETPNLFWGTYSRTKLGHYDLHTDTIVISKLFMHSSPVLLDFIMYHEMLHKKHKFTATGKNSRFHTASFRRDEKLFENFSEVNTALETFLKLSRKLS